MGTRRVLLALVLSCTTFTTLAAHNVHLMGAQGVNLWKLEQQDKLTNSGAAARGSQPPSRYMGLSFEDKGAQQVFQPSPKEDYPEFPPQWFEQPLDHFAKDPTEHTWNQRYWVNLRHYQPRPGAPVIVLDGGETSGEDRLPFLDTGIVDILAKSTRGIGIVLEHRYYGESYAVANLTTDSLRWLNNAQAAADSANFMAKLVLDGVAEDITAPNTPWIYYGESGSYAGARAAHMKVLYPDLVYGAIASSAVTHAELSNWKYMDIIRLAADPICMTHIENSIKTIDAILPHGYLNKALKGAFGLAELEHDEDFVSMLESPLGAWQSRNWDPSVGSTRFDQFCEAINKPPFKHGGGDELLALPYEHPDRLVTLPGGLKLDFSILNYAKYIKETYVEKCTSTIEDCFGTYDDTPYQETGLEQDWRLWTFQYCTEWGYFTTAPPNQTHPTIISRLLTLEYESKICQQSFPPGDNFVVPALPNVTVVNELGDFDLAADYLAFIDGEVDPWRPDTPHSEDAWDREDTIIRPFKVIPGGVHHWDENGLADVLSEPADIRKIHGEMVYFINEWLDAWKAPTVKA